MIQILSTFLTSFSTCLPYVSSVCLVTQLCLTLCNFMDCSLPGSSVHGILQARVLEWVAMPSCRGSSQPRDQTQVSLIAGRHFTVWATREALTFLKVTTFSPALRLGTKGSHCWHACHWLDPVSLRHPLLGAMWTGPAWAPLCPQQYHGAEPAGRACWVNGHEMSGRSWRQAGAGMDREPLNHTLTLCAGHTRPLSAALGSHHPSSRSLP